MIQFSQELVDAFFNSWIGVSTYNTNNYNIGPSAFGLYFPNKSIALKSYLFMKEWNIWQEDYPLTLSIIRESSTKYSFYFFKIGRNEFVKGTFEENLNVEELHHFIENEKNRKFVVLARYSNQIEDIIDNPIQDFFLINGLNYKNRNEVKKGEIENN